MSLVLNTILKLWELWEIHLKTFVNLTPDVLYNNLFLYFLSPVEA
jgi:hypothetical protein